MYELGGLRLVSISVRSLLFPPVARRSQHASTTVLGADFDALYRAHAPDALRLARRMLGNEADAHEVVHDLFVSLLEAPRQYAGRGGLTAFMYAAVRHACLNRLRNQRTRLKLLQLKQPEREAQHEPIQPEVRATVLSALQRMPRELATTAVYRHVAGLTHDEIAVLLQCSPRRIGNLLTRVSDWAHRDAGGLADRRSHAPLEQ